MATPRVFISSTYYDLRHVREDIGNFIKSLGYDPVMHDKGGVTYAQTETLESSCYSELQNCDIVVCIIGNKYGTKSQDGDLSITMNELMSAIKARKKIYIYVLKEVDIENRTYLKNKDKDFDPASVDNIKIHQFIAEIKDNIKNHPIETFENISDITDNLKKQFAGLFQRLLSNDASVTETKTAYDLQSSADTIQNSIKIFNEEMEKFWVKFDSTFFAPNNVIRYLQKLLGYTDFFPFISNKKALIEYLNSIGFYEINEEKEDDYTTYVKSDYIIEKDFELKLTNRLFDNEDKINKKIPSAELSKYIIYKEYDFSDEYLDLDFDDEDEYEEDDVVDVDLDESNFSKHK